MKTEAEIKDKLNDCKKWLNLGIKSRDWGLAASETFRIKLLKWVLDKPKQEGEK